jgi:excisionase family DNA binding protein
MPPEDYPEILTLSQAAELLNCHPNTLRNWEEQGFIKCFRLGPRGDRRFRKKDLLKLLKSG